MSTSNIDRQYITYLRHKNAVNTIARFLNVPTSQVLAGLDRKINGHKGNADTPVNPLYDRHRNAIDTVARYGGLPVEQVIEGLESRTQDEERSVSAPAAETRVAVGSN